MRKILFLAETFEVLKIVFIIDKRFLVSHYGIGQNFVGIVKIKPVYVRFMTEHGAIQTYCAKGEVGLLQLCQMFKSV